MIFFGFQMKNTKKQPLQNKTSSHVILQTVKTVAEKYDQQKDEISVLFETETHWINKDLWSQVKVFFDLWTKHIERKNDQLFSKKVTLRFFRK